MIYAFKTRQVSSCSKKLGDGQGIILRIWIFFPSPLPSRRTRSWVINGSGSAAPSFDSRPSSKTNTSQDTNTNTSQDTNTNTSQDTNTNISQDTNTKTSQDNLGENYGLQTTTRINQSSLGIINDKKSNKATNQWSLSLSPIGLVSNHYSSISNQYLEVYKMTHQNLPNALFLKLK